MEYQFSVIDPIRFEQDVSGVGRLACEPSQGDQVSYTAIDQNTTTVRTSNDCHDYADKNDALVNSHEELMPAWLSDSSRLDESVENGRIPHVPSETNRRFFHTTCILQTRANPNHSPDPEQWKTLLRSYYRMSEPCLPRTLQTQGSALIEHYFRDVCVIFSSFDSAMNPFRTVIARLWDNSSSIYFAIQSMAAAHLANSIPSMRLTGLTMQKKAYACLQQELQLASINHSTDDKLLLAVLLLGLTACWHDSSDLGVAHLSAARALIHPRLIRDNSDDDETPQSAESRRNDQFFAEALIYWEMCMAFVSRETFVVPVPQRRRIHSPSIGNDTTALPSTQKIFPHPWTGIAPRVQMLFAEVGRLVRHHCNVQMALHPSATDSNAITTAATDLEEQLLSVDIPTASDLVDVQDERTRPVDFVNVAEATKCAALLQIYRVFPSILACRLGKPGGAPPAPGFDGRDDVDVTSEDMDQSEWLTSFATHILNLLAQVPSSSGNRPQQLILLVTAATELRYSSTEPSSHTVSAPSSSLSSPNPDVTCARTFAMARLQELAARLPSRPVVRIIDLVKEVWRRSDGGEDQVFWMDVMIANGWETVMG